MGRPTTMAPDSTGREFYIAPVDSKGRTIKVGDQVRFRGMPYTIEKFWPREDGDPLLIQFVEAQHTDRDEMPRL